MKKEGLLFGLLVILLLVLFGIGLSPKTKTHDDTDTAQTEEPMQQQEKEQEEVAPEPEEEIEEEPEESTPLSKEGAREFIEVIAEESFGSRGFEYEVIEIDNSLILLVKVDEYSFTEWLSDPDGYDYLKETMEDASSKAQQSLIAQGYSEAFAVAFGKDKEHMWLVASQGKIIYDVQDDLNTNL